MAEGLVSHAEDAKDANLPLMVWYGIEPLVAADGKRAVTLAAKSKLPVASTIMKVGYRIAPSSKSATPLSASKSFKSVTVINTELRARTQMK